MWRPGRLPVSHKCDIGVWHYVAPFRHISPNPLMGKEEGLNRPLQTSRWARGGGATPARDAPRGSQGVGGGKIAGGLSIGNRPEGEISKIATFSRNGRGFKDG
jgi:hypothetical protein